MKVFEPNETRSESTRPEPPSGPAAAAENALQDKTLLLVDDEQGFREMAAQILNCRGLHVLQSGCVAEALRVAATTAPIHLLLTDFSLPDGNGFDLARQFRGLHPQAPIILVSGAAAVLTEKADALDQFDTLAKPFTFQELLRRVHALLAGAPPLAEPGYLALLSNQG